LEELEEHLLVCQECRQRLALEDDFLQGMRDAGKVLEREQGGPRYWRSIRRSPWGPILAAVVVLVFATIMWAPWRRAPVRPAVVFLEAMRGTQNAPAAAGQPLILALDITGVPQLPEYGVKIVDEGGSLVFESKAAAQDNQARATLMRGLPAGRYFVRLHAPTGELLREYALTVRA